MHGETLSCGEEIATNGGAILGDQEHLTNSNEPHEFTGSVAPTDSADWYIVGIGASAGGLEAIEKLFDQMPSQTGMAFVLVQHLSPDFKSLMDELLSRHTRMQIHRVTEGMTVEPNCIYLIPPKKNMKLADGKLLLTEQQTVSGPNLPIDIFFRSLAEDAAERAIAVVLSGTGSDGSRGIREVHAKGGLVIVQSVESAAFDGMPKVACATGVADIICEPERIAESILQYVQQPDAFPRGHTDPLAIPVDESDLATVYRLFRHRYGVDFSQYRFTTMGRRIDRRMKLLHIANLKEYSQLLEEDKEELELLYRDLLVEVTSFFRDSAAFHLLRRDIIPNIVDQSSEDDSIRIWVPGCATGEEAYSIAMLFHEAATRRMARPDIKVFATDVFRGSLESASSGIYSGEALTKVPADLRQRYFVRHGDLFQVSKDLRKIVVFAPHDITKDPPFTKIDFLSCRNVLIYFDPEVQKRVIANFHFALRVHGHMFLGSSESVGDYSREFEALDSHWRVFSKIRDVRLPNSVGSLPVSSPISTLVRNRQASVVSIPGGGENIVGSVFEELLEKYVPPSFLVDSHYDLIHSFGAARTVLVQPKGRPTLEVLKMIEGELKTALTSALHRAKRDNTAVAYKDVNCTVSGLKTTIELIVEPFEKRSQKFFLVTLLPVAASERQTGVVAERFDFDDQTAKRSQEIERELLYTKESLQSTVEELETSNEELQSTNEELVAANEELQSTNEELHSVNEELYTVNAEHQRKIDELTQLTADMDNLFRSAEVGTIFLDSDLRIRKFTPAASSAFHILEQDIGRPIAHIASNLDNPDFLDHVEATLETGESSEREVHSRDGHCYLKTIRAYRLADGTIDGVVVTFVDVSLLKQAQRQLELLLDTTINGIAYLDTTLRFVFMNQQFSDQLGWDRALISGKRIREVFTVAEFAKCEPHFALALEGDRQIFALNKLIDDEPVQWSISLVPDIRKEEVVGIFISSSTITDFKCDELVWAAIENASVAMIVIDGNGVIKQLNSVSEQSFGYSRRELVNQDFEMLVPNRDRHKSQALRDTILQTLESPEVSAAEQMVCVKKNGTEIQVDAKFATALTPWGKFILCSLNVLTQSENLEYQDSESISGSE